MENGRETNRFQSVLKAYHYKRRTQFIAGFLSAIVMISVVFSMTQMADATNISATCGYLEHRHTGECYYRRLVCTETASDHMHDESCFEYVLICGKHAHVHNASCFTSQGSGHFLSLLELFSPIAQNAPEQVIINPVPQTVVPDAQIIHPQIIPEAVKESIEKKEENRTAETEAPVLQPVKDSGPEAAVTEENQEAANAQH